MNKWIKVSDQLPPENVVVETKVDEDGNVRNEQDLQYARALWWDEKMTMYTYYTPTHWRYKN